MNGLLVIDKPSGMTSRDVVNRVQRWFPRKTKIGHTGTLDPLATGVLVVCVGQATRLADYVQAMGKSYASRFRLGATSTTDDADGTITETPNATAPTREQIDSALKSFIGSVEQVPPAVSALKLNGVRAYELVRQGKGPKLDARVVMIDAIRVLAYEWPFLDVEVDCGKGTYIRSIARDLGDMLGCGGLVQTLRRTKVGPFTAEQGIGLDVTPEEAKAKLQPLATAATGMPRVFLELEEARRLFHGQEIRVPPRSGHHGGWITVAVMAPGMKLFAVGEDSGSGLLRPVTVFANPDG
ncbi:MAG: tRNA pseudouridine(55) synthase TruB [Planctomycetia bacterium]|nr:tRNA pseudouridine(55) synthase TruB [Planctomycetia bacterium]